MKRLAGPVAFVALLAPFATPPAENPAAVQAPDQLPDTVVAVVSHVPQALGRLTSREFQRALAQVAAPHRAPRPGSGEYERLKRVALESRLELIWIQGQAAEMGIKVSTAEVSRSGEGQESELPQLCRLPAVPKAIPLSRRRGQAKVQILSVRIEGRVTADVATATSMKKPSRNSSPTSTGAGGLAPSARPVMPSTTALEVKLPRFQRDHLG